jgi:hypothetical protein
MLDSLHQSNVDRQCAFSQLALRMCLLRTTFLVCWEKHKETTLLQALYGVNSSAKLPPRSGVQQKLVLQVEDLKSQQALTAQLAEKQTKRGQKSLQDPELRNLHSTLQGAAEEEAAAEVDEETAQYIGQLQRLKTALELFRQQQVRPPGIVNRP